MNRRKLQIIAKIGFLLVVIGFFMPITCSLNGFEIAGEISDLGGNDEAVILLYILFGSALLGGIFLFLNRHSLVTDWIIFIVCFGSGLITYSLVNKMAGKLQGGGYLIIIGWIVTGISLLVATTTSEEDQENSNDSFHFKFMDSEAFKKLKATGEKLTINHMPESRSNGEKSTIDHTPESRSDGETLGTFDFSKTVVLDWPVELESGSLTKDSRSKDPEILKGYIVVRNVQPREILYMEWQLACFDILNKPILTDSPVKIRHEEHFSPKQTVTVSTTGSIPFGTRSFTPYLKAVLYGDQEIEEFSDGIETTNVGPKTEIRQNNDYDGQGLSSYQQNHGLKEMPVYYYEKNDEGIWTCAFCGTRNKKDAAKCRLCSMEISQQELCSRKAIEQVFGDWKQYLEQKSEERRLQREEEEKIRLEETQKRKAEEELKAQEERKLAEKKRNRTKACLKKLAIIILALVVVSGIGLVMWNTVFENMYLYGEAKDYAEDDDYKLAIQNYWLLWSYRDSKDQLFDSYQKLFESEQSVKVQEDVYQRLLDRRYDKEKIFIAFAQSLPTLVSEEEQIEGWRWLETKGYSGAKEGLYKIAQNMVMGGRYYKGYELYASLGGYEDAQGRSLEGYIQYLEAESFDTNLSNISLIEGYQWLLDNGYPQGKIYNSFQRTLATINSVKEQIEGWRWLETKGYSGAKEGLYDLGNALIALGDLYNGYEALIALGNFKNTLEIVNEIATITVTLDPKGGEIQDGTASLVVMYDKPYGNLPTPIRDESKFVGWYTSINGEEIEINSAKQVMILSNHNVYAKWFGPFAVKGIGPAGGYVFYDKGIYSDGWRYLEIAPVDTEWDNKVWGGYGTDVVGIRTAIGTGKSNTDKIVTTLRSGDYAAYLCANLVVITDGEKYDDWFMPSLDELNTMFQVLQKSNLGSFSDDSYWSSSEYSSPMACSQNFRSGSQFLCRSKQYHIRVRAVRAF